MAKKGQHAWLMESAPGAERERLLSLRGETIALQEEGGVRRKLRKKVVHRTPTQKFFYIGFNVIFWVLVAGLLSLMFSAYQSKREGGIPTVFGFSVFRVETGSMVPTLPIGSFAVVRAPSDPAALPVGTITTFKRADGVVVTHRIIEIVYGDDGAPSYRTKGDNPINSPDEELLTPDRVIGTFVFKIALPSVWGGD